MDETIRLTDLRQVLEGDYVSIDIEGDGNNPPSPVEVCIVEYAAGKPGIVHHWLINPEKPITDFVQGIHGITDEMVRDAPRFSDIETEVRRLLHGNTVVAHGAKDDLLMLRTVMPDVDFLPAAVIDTQRMARSLMPGLPRYRLESVCEALGIATAPRNGRIGLHTATGDAVITASVFRTLVSMIPHAPKKRSHFAAMAQVLMSPTERAARLAALEELAAWNSRP